MIDEKAEARRWLAQIADSATVELLMSRQYVFFGNLSPDEAIEAGDGPLVRWWASHLIDPQPEYSDRSRDLAQQVMEKASANLRAAGVPTPATMVRVPNQPKTPLKSFRIPQELYEAAQKKAAAEGVPLSAVIRSALEKYVKR